MNITEAETSKPNYEKILLQFLASLCFCDHMGDVSNDIIAVLNRMNIHIDQEDEEKEWPEPLQSTLRKMGVCTLYGTSLVEESQ